MFSDMAATMERLEEYRTHNTQFCKRLYEYSCIMFTAQVSSILVAPQFLTRSKAPLSRHCFWVIQMDFSIPADAADRKLRTTRI
jgi:hypothetical protein